eukprot:gene29018-38392_t
MTTSNDSASSFLPNLASPLLGANIVFATDEWFAAADNMIQDSDPLWRENEYTPFGKWMDGWESRRRRTEGNDWCIVSLGLAGSIATIEVNTAYFTGNFSPKVRISGIYLDQTSSEMSVVEKLLEKRTESARARPEFGRMGLNADAEEFQLVSELRSESWPLLVPLSPLGAGYKETQITTFQLSIQTAPHTSSFWTDKEIDLAAVENGGLALHYGHPRNLIAPGRGSCMGDGWETARQPARPAVYQKGEDGLM